MAEWCKYVLPGTRLTFKYQEKNFEVTIKTECMMWPRDRKSIWMRCFSCEKANWIDLSSPGWYEPVPSGKVATLKCPCNP